MVLEPGGAEGDSDNRHRGADQWLYVLSGSGQAMINGKRHKLARGSLPPAYRSDGNELPRGRK